MCWCDPQCRTPFCGKTECHAPVESKIHSVSGTKLQQIESRPTYRATKKLLQAIYEGEFKPMMQRSTRWVSPHYECLLDINKDWTLSLIVDEDCIKSNPDYFQEIVVF